ncbi:squalene synthase-like isoform X1 [Solanum stenotomum]|uniref:squalene synthase-like isoform X1 n=1 Tax=Solanum stenotomum TaxID=172797 RepID=UPI0020D179F8|nr:squalene synthase-like isoform X1 [Solanum stenotomum]
MGLMQEILMHPDELYPLIKLMLSAKRVEKKTSVWLLQPHWAFCYTTLRKVSRSFALVIQQLPSDLRNVVCVYYLVLRALDTVEDDTSLAIEVRVPILRNFYCNFYDPQWHFSCGTKAFKVLMDQFHHVSTAFLELDTNYQEVIKDITKRMGEGMAKFLCKEVETIDDYNEYSFYASGLCGLGLSKFFYVSGREDLAPESISISMGLFLQKISIIRDYLEDINEVPKCRMFWPRQIWSKYVNKLEDFKYEENSVKAVQCLNEMVTNALLYVEDCLTSMSSLRDPAIFQFCAIPQIINMGNLSMFYNNIEIFKGVVEMRRGLCAKIIDQTRTMADVYGAFYDFCCIMESKVDRDDPNATSTLKRLEAILKICRDSGTLHQRKSYTFSHQTNYNIPVLIIFFFIMMAILLSTKIP